MLCQLLNMLLDQSIVLYICNSEGLDTPKNAASFCMLFFEVLPFTTLAVSVNGETSKRGVQE